MENCLDCTKQSIVKRLPWIPQWKGEVFRFSGKVECFVPLHAPVWREKKECLVTHKPCATGDHRGMSVYLLQLEGWWSCALGKCAVSHPTSKANRDLKAFILGLARRPLKHVWSGVFCFHARGTIPDNLFRKQKEKTDISLDFGSRAP